MLADHRDGLSSSSFLAWSSIAQSVCQRAFSLLAIRCLGPRVQILHSAEEHTFSPFYLNIACLCQSIEINNKYVCMYVCMYVCRKNCILCRIRFHSEIHMQHNAVIDDTYWYWLLTVKWRRKLTGNIGISWKKSQISIWINISHISVLEYIHGIKSLV